MPFSDNGNTLFCIWLRCVTSIEYVVTHMAGGHRFIDDLVWESIADEGGFDSLLVTMMIYVDYVSLLNITYICFYLRGLLIFR